MLSIFFRKPFEFVCDKTFEKETTTEQMTQILLPSQKIIVGHMGLKITRRVKSNYIK